METAIAVTHLEMTNPADFRPSRSPAENLQMIRVEHPLPELNRFLYVAAGRQWGWRDRLIWSRERWLEYLDRTQLETWVGYVAGTPAGYYELERQESAAVEIAYFGLIPQFIGRGLGGWMLSCAVERAWAGGTRRVWLHTCELDHPAAMNNYLARGFRVFKTEMEQKEETEFQGEVPWSG